MFASCKKKDQSHLHQVQMMRRPGVSARVSRPYEDRRGARRARISVDDSVIVDGVREGVVRHVIYDGHVSYVVAFSDDEDYLVSSDRVARV